MRLTRSRSSALDAERLMALPSDLLILLLPSMPGSRCVADKSARASTNTARPARRFSARTISLVCSIIGTWSSPTGMTVARKPAMSADWLTGYMRKPAGMSRAKPRWRISSRMVGLRSRRATVTRFKNRTVSSASSGMADCSAIAERLGSIPTDK